jgi:uncharacterized glyoxalase superfamily protein PhnB
MADMKSYAKNCKSTIIPALRYQNAIAMIEWLCDTFGFEKQAVYATPEGIVMHAQLTFGNGMIMIGSVDNGSKASSQMTQPNQIGGVETQSPCLIVSECEPLYAKAKAAGAKMLLDLQEQSYGGKSFTCSDPEGHIWHIGTYDPWEPEEQSAGA